MDHRLQQQSTSDRERYGAGFARRAHVEGNGQFINKMKGSKIVSDSICDNGSPVGHMVTFESRQNSSRRASRTPSKMPTHEEMSREKKVREPSPSVIAKLMGLDSLPSPQVVSKQQENRICLPKATYTSYQGHSVAGTSTREHQEFKDVFEINDSTKFEIHRKQYERHKSQPAYKANSCVKENDTDLAFIRQKFMEAKRLSTNENLQNSRELNDALEVLDSNRDLLIRFLEEPNPLSSKHLQDWKNFTPAPHESHITVLKSSKGKRFETDDVSRKSQVKPEKCSQMQKDSVNSLRKPTTNLFNHSLQEHSGSLSHKLLKSRSAGKANTNHRSTRIVVLKPNLGKAQELARNVSQQRSHENYSFGYRKQQEVPHSVFHELHAEGRERHNLFDDVDIMEQRTKGSREIAREIAKQMRHSINTGSRKMLGSGFNRSIKDEMYIANNSEAYRRTPENFEYRNITSSPSTSSLTELSLSREARKRLSERWIMTHRLQQERIADKASSTLGEMLAQDSSTAQKISDERPHFYPCRITRGNGWKDDCSTNLPRSSSFPASSTQCTPKVSRHQVSNMLKDVLNLGVVDPCDGSLNQRRSSSHKRFKVQNYKPHLNSGGEENKLPVRESHVNQEELRNGIHVTDRSEVLPKLAKFSDSNMSNPRSAVMGSENVERPFIASEGHIRQPEQEEESSAIVYVDDAIVEKSPDYTEESGSEPLIISEESEQPSIASVLDHPSEECVSSPECFEKVNAGLQELRFQLQLLRSESDAYNRECETPLLSEAGAKEGNSLIQKFETTQYRNEEDRDYSYLQDSLLSNSSLDLDVFEKLEEKYVVLTEWSKCERKFLFDLSSFILEEIHRKPKRNFGHEELIKEVWRRLVRLREVLGRGKSEETILDPRWLDLGDDVDLIGRDIGGMLEDDLLEELVSEFVLDRLELVR